MKNRFTKRGLTVALAAFVAASMIPGSTVAALAADAEPEAVAVEAAAEDAVAAEAAAEDVTEANAGTVEAEAETNPETDGAAETAAPETEETDLADPILTTSEEEASIVYAMMNVPYRDFYAAYGLTDQAVWEVEEGIDAVSTATTSKFTQTTGLAKGTYNNGKYIMGVTIPVQLPADKYNELAAAGRTNSDSYYVEAMESAPAAYSTVTVNADNTLSFSAFQNAEIDTSYLQVKDLELNGGYGDYEVLLGGFNTSATENHPKGIQISATEAVADYTIYGAYLNTTDGGKYGMTALENLWYGTSHPEVAIAWSTLGGQRLQRGHGRGGEFYQFDIAGKTMSSITVLTSIGVIEVPCTEGGMELPAYYAGDTSSLAYSMSSESDELSVSGVPADFGDDVRVNLSYKSGKLNTYIAEDAVIADGKVKLSEAPKDGTSYTLIITGNGNAIIRGLATSLSEAQRTQLTELIETAKNTNGYADNTDLQEHVTEAEELLANTSATSTEAASLIKELQEKIKKTQPAAQIVSAELAGTCLKVTMEQNDLENAVYKLTSGSGRNVVTLASGSLTSDIITLDAAAQAGTEYTLTISSDNYQDASVKVTAIAGSIALEDMTATYNGAAVEIGEAAVTAVDGTVAYTYYTDAECTNVLSGAPVNVGTYYVKASAGDVESNVAVLTIKAVSINDAVATAPAQTYTGSALKPAVTVKTGDTALKAGTDYTVSYKNNVNAGTATATITGKGNYAGTTTAAFKINAASLSKATVTAKAQTYTGSAKKPAVTVKVGNKTLKANADYTVKYSNNTKAGKKAAIVITGKGNYAGTANGTFTINKAKTTFTVKASKAKVKVSALKKKAQKVTIKASKLTKGSSKVTYSIQSVSNKQKSKVKLDKKTGTVTIKKGAKACTIKIKATSKANANRKAASKTVTIKVTK